MAEITKIKLSDGNTYDIVDTGAREEIESLKDEMIDNAIIKTSQEWNEIKESENIPSAGILMIYSDTREVKISDGITLPKEQKSLYETAAPTRQMGYYWYKKQWDENSSIATLYLSNLREGASEEEAFELPQGEIQFQIGDMLSIHGTSMSFIDCAKVKLIENNKFITIEFIDFTPKDLKDKIFYLSDEREANIGYSISYSLWCLNKPSLGVVHINQGAIALGVDSKAVGYAAAAIGNETEAIGPYSFAEGNITKTYGEKSHAEGGKTEAHGSSSHAEGYATKAYGLASHAEGSNSVAEGSYSHTEGYGNMAFGKHSHVEGAANTAMGNCQHVQGRYNILDVKRDNSGNMLDKDGNITADESQAAPAEKYAHIIGNGTKDARSNAYTLDWKGNAWFAGSVTVGDSNKPVLTQDDYIRAGRLSGTPIGTYATAEGYNNKASGSSSHAEGSWTEAKDSWAHAEGYLSQANGAASHAEGYGSIADGVRSHAEGWYAHAVSKYQHVQGKHNIPDYMYNEDGSIKYDVNGKPIVAEKYAHIVGNGTSYKDKKTGEIVEVKSNAHTLDWEGNAWFAGDIRLGGIGYEEGQSIRDIAKEEVANIVDGAPEALDTLKEVADWIANDETGTSAIIDNINNLEEQMSAHQTEFEILQEEVEGKAIIDNTVIGEDAWSSKNTVDKLCPSFVKTGKIVECNPAEGYPLSIISNFEIEEEQKYNGIILYRTNDNLLYDKGSGWTSVPPKGSVKTDVNQLDGSVTIKITQPITQAYYYQVGHFFAIGGISYKLSGCPDGDGSNTYCLYTSNGSGSFPMHTGGNPTSFTNTGTRAPAVFITIEPGIQLGTYKFKPMISYETYYGNYKTPNGERIVIEKDFTLQDTNYSWENILGRADVNIIQTALQYNVPNDNTKKLLKEINSTVSGKLDSAWSSKSTIDKLCPSFTETGGVVSCEPVEDYPLEIGYEPKNLAVLRSMANYNIEGLTSSVNEDNTILINGISTIDANNIYLTNTAQWGNGIQLQSGTYTIKVEVVDGTITNATCVLSISATDVSTKYEYFNLNEAKTFTVSTLSSVIAIIQFAKDGEASNAKVRLQIEKGKEYTGYVDYNATPTTITQCGKNLWNLKTSGVKTVTYYNEKGEEKQRYGYEIRLPAGTYTAHCEQAREIIDSEKYVYGVIVDAETKKQISGISLRANANFYTRTFTIEEGQYAILYHGYTGISNSAANALFDTGYNIQIELGSVETPYEEYSGNTFAFGEQITANSGVNYLFADKGTIITVKGRANPVSIIEKLTNAIIALGGNI